MSNLEYVQNKLNKMAKFCKNQTNSEICENLAIQLGNPNFESLIFELSTFETNNVDINSNQFNELYTSLVNYKF